LEILLPAILILAGLLLIAVEVYLVPGVNVVGILGTLLLLGAAVYSFSVFGLIGGLSTLAFSTVVGGGIGYLAWKSGAFNRFVLSANLDDRSESLNQLSEDRSKYLGKEGVAITPLRPTGVAEIEGDRVEVHTEGGFISAGSKVKVVAMDRRRWFVRLAGESGTTTTPQTAEIAG